MKLILWSLILIVTVVQAGSLSIKPIDNKAELTNPDMGWTLYMYDDGLDVYGSKILPKDTLSDWPGMSTVYLRIPWSVLEPEEGKYCWYIIDDQLRKFASKGIKIGLRFTVTESFIQDGTPVWVQKAGAKGTRFTHGIGIRDNGQRWEPDYNDPIFLAKLDNFLKAAAKRYNNPAEVAFVDIGTFGIWGEGHTWLGTSLAFSNEVVKKHIDLHVKYFDKVPVLGESGFFERKGCARPPKMGTCQLSYVFSIPKAFAGKRYELRVHLNNPYTGKIPAQFNNPKDNTCTIGWISFDSHGVPTIEKNNKAILPKKLSAAYAVTLDKLEYDPTRFKYNGKIHVRFRFAKAQPSHVSSLLSFNDAKTEKLVSAAKESRIGGELLKYMKSKNTGYRDDSVIVSPLTAAIQGVYIMDEFWRDKPIVLELAHHSHILKNKSWYDGDDAYRAVVDNHASQISIHHWPREFLRENRELVRKINLVIGYRFQATDVNMQLAVPGTLAGKLTFRNAGVAPAYQELYPTITLKNDNNGICGSFTLGNFRVDQVMPGKSKSKKFSFLLPKIQYASYRGLIAGNEYNVYLSVGSLTGKPLINLPLDNSDGEKRYKIGRITAGVKK